LVKKEQNFFPQNNEEEFSEVEGKGVGTITFPRIPVFSMRRSPRLREKVKTIQIDNFRKEEACAKEEYDIACIFYF